MLLNEFLKEHRKVEEQQATIAELKSNSAQQQKQIEALTAVVQKVSDQLSKRAPQLVANVSKIMSLLFSRGYGAGKPSP